MSEREEQLFKAFVEQSSGYFEFGMGGSTLYAAQRVQGPIIAIDSDRRWVDGISAQVAGSPFRRELLFVDIGPTGDWGFPTSTEKRDNYPAYSGAITAHAADIDLCLVDGRFRVACFLQALRHLASDAILGIHDFRSRDHYHAVLEFARPIAEAEDMTFFASRRSIDAGRLERVLADHLFDPR